MTPADTIGRALGGMEPKWRAFAAMAMTYFLLVSASSMSFLVLPDIADDFDVTLRTVGWVVIIESLLVAACLLPVGSLADRVGRFDATERVWRCNNALHGLDRLLVTVS